MVLLVLPVSCGKDEPVAEGGSEADSSEATAGLSAFEGRLAALEPYTANPRTEIINRWYPNTTYELIPRDDYGKLYPFPAYAEDMWNVLYGLMTADGRIVVDGLFEFVWFIDKGDGYYRAHRFLPEQGWETRYIAADGSRELILPERSAYYAMLADETVRVFMHERLDIGDSWWETMQVGVLDMNGNIISPFIRVSENYIYYSFGGGQFVDALFVNINTGEHFVCFLADIWVGFEGGEYIVESATINARGEIEATFIHTPSIGSTRWFIKDGITLKVGDYIIMRDENAEDEIIDEGEEWEWVRPHESVVLTDKDGNILMTFSHGIDFRGELFHCNNSRKTYDFNLNVYDFGEYSALMWHFEGDIYVFAIPGYWDENDMWVGHESVYIDITSGEHIDEEQLFPNVSAEASPPAASSLLYVGDGLSAVIIDDFMGVINQDGDWLIKIDMLKNND
jgi:hypothetical protein